MYKLQRHFNNGAPGGGAPGSNPEDAPERDFEAITKQALQDLSREVDWQNDKDVTAKERQDFLKEMVGKNPLRESLRQAVQDPAYKTEFTTWMNANPDLSRDEKEMLAAFLATTRMLAQNPGIMPSPREYGESRETKKSDRIQNLFDRHGRQMMDVGFEKSGTFDAERVVTEIFRPILSNRQVSSNPEEDAQAQVEAAQALVESEGKGFGSMLSFLKPGKEETPATEYEILLEALGAKDNPADIEAKLKAFIRESKTLTRQDVETKYYKSYEFEGIYVDDDGNLAIENIDGVSPEAVDFAREMEKKIDPGWKNSDEATAYLNKVLTEDYRGSFDDYLKDEVKPNFFTRTWRMAYGFFRSLKLENMPLIGGFFKGDEEEAKTKGLSESMAEWVKMPASEKQKIKDEAAHAKRLQVLGGRVSGLAGEGNVRFAPGYQNSIDTLTPEESGSFEKLLTSAGNTDVKGTALKKGFEIPVLVEVFDQVERSNMKLSTDTVETATGIETPFVIVYENGEKDPLSWEELKQGARKLRRTELEHDIEGRPEAWTPFLAELEAMETNADGDKVADYVRTVDEKLAIDWDNLSQDTVMGHCLYTVMPLESLQYVHNLVKEGYITGEPKTGDAESFTLRVDEEGELSAEEDPFYQETLEWEDVEKHERDLPGFIDGKLVEIKDLMSKRKEDLKTQTEVEDLIAEGKFGYKWEYNKADRKMEQVPQAQFAFNQQLSEFSYGKIKVERDGDGWKGVSGPFRAETYDTLGEAMIVTTVLNNAYAKLNKAGWSLANQPAEFQTAFTNWGIQWDPDEWVETSSDVEVVTESQVTAIGNYSIPGGVGKLSQHNIMDRLNMAFAREYPSQEDYYHGNINDKTLLAA